MRLLVSNLALLGAALLPHHVLAIASLKSPSVTEADSALSTTATVTITLNTTEDGTGDIDFSEYPTLFKTFDARNLKVDFKLAGCTWGCKMKSVMIYDGNASAVLSAGSGIWNVQVDNSLQPSISSGQNIGLRLETSTSNDDFSQAVSGSVTIINAAGLARILLPSSNMLPRKLQFRFKFDRYTDEFKRTKSLDDLRSPIFGLAHPEISNDQFQTYKAQFHAYPPLPDDPRSDGTTPGGSEGGTLGGGTSPTTSTAPGEASSTSLSVALPSGNGLSTGAIAGIAVGAGLVVLLLGTAIAWLLMRRRRQSNAGKPGLGYEGGAGRSGDMVAEKEANAIVAESPHSPYSEDGHHRDSTLVGGASATSSGATGLMAAHRHDRDAPGDYPPYTDHPPVGHANAPPTIAPPVARTGSANSRSTADRSSAAFPASAVPPPAIGEDGVLPPRADTGMSGRYAHLVEEGMTPEEIARLEDEERQLDVAIEQARGVTTK